MSSAATRGGDRPGSSDHVAGWTESARSGRQECACARGNAEDTVVGLNSSEVGDPSREVLVVPCSHRFDVRCDRAWGQVEAAARCRLRSRQAITFVVTVQFVGSGDAFGTDGRFQACISLRWPQAHVQLDCGASSLIALKRLGLNPRSVDAVIVSHLHGDHFGGLAFLVLDQQFVRRERPLTIAGPIGLRERLLQAMDVLFTGSSSVERRFELNVLELAERMPTRVGPAEVTSLEVVHPSGAAAYGMRIRCDDKVVAYSGDTEWTDSLLELAAGADVFICEAYTFKRLPAVCADRSRPRRQGV